MEEATRDALVHRTTSGNRRRASLVGRAWRRILLKDGKLHADAKIVIKDMFMVADYFGRGYDVTNPHKTLELAVKRAFVSHILAALSLDRDEIGDFAHALEVRNDTRLEEEMMRDDD